MGKIYAVNIFIEKIPTPVNGWQPPSIIYIRRVNSSRRAEGKNSHGTSKLFNF